MLSDYPRKDVKYERIECGIRYSILKWEDKNYLVDTQGSEGHDLRAPTLDWLGKGQSCWIPMYTEF